MEKKFNLGSLMTVIVIVGVLVSFLVEAQPFQAIGQEVESEMAGQPVEFLLDELNMVLMLVAIGGLIIYLFYRAARKE